MIPKTRVGGCTVVLVLAIVSTGLSEPLPAAIMGGLSARLQQLQNITVDFTLSQKFNPSPSLLADNGKNLPSGGLIRVQTQPLEFAEQFSFLNGKSRYDEQYLGSDAEYPLFSRLEVYTTERFETLQYLKKDSKPTGRIDNPRRLPRDSLIECATGIRLESADEWLTPDDLRGMTFSLSDDDHVVAKVTDARNLTWVLNFSKKMRYALVSYQLLSAPSASPIRVMENNDFRDVKGVMLPFEIKESAWDYDESPPREVKTSEIKVNSYKVGSAENTDFQYAITYPVGAVVLDTRTGLTFAINRKPSTLSDEDIARIIQEGDQKKRAAQKLINQVLGTQPATQP